jgi:hypothetical protein
MIDGTQLPHLHYISESREEERRVNVSLARLNAIVDHGHIASYRIAHPYRLALKDTLRLFRQVIATEPDPEVRAIYRRQLGYMKRLHWCLLNLEVIAVEWSKRNN